MTQSLVAHFDGNVIVPDEPVELQVGQPLRIAVAIEPPIDGARRQLGSLRGTVQFIAPDFDAPLDEFKEYM
jgi:hypothetical protein